MKKLLPIIAGINGLLLIDLRGETAGLSAEEQAAVKEMSQSLASTTQSVEDKIGGEILKANIRGDSLRPDRFQSKVKIKLERVKYDTNRLLGPMKKWIQIKVIALAETEDKNIKWSESCKVKIYVGYENCRADGKMLLFKSDCTCATLPTNKEQSIFFFIPGDIRQKYNLPDVPDYCAICFTTDGISQPMIITNREGKDTYRSDGDDYHKQAKERSFIEDRVMRNVDELPNYVSKTIDNHPTLLLEVDA